MSESVSQVLRLQPVSDMPSTPCANILIESLETDKLQITMVYSLIIGNPKRDLVVNFDGAIGFRLYWEGDGISSGKKFALPMCNDPFAIFAWPLVEITNSEWLASGEFNTSKAIRNSAGKPALQHFRIVSLDRYIEIIAENIPSCHWIESNF